jgi:hypothetical protein
MHEVAGYGFQRLPNLAADFAGSTLSRTQTQAPKGYSLFRFSQELLPPMPDFSALFGLFLNY